MVTIGAIANGFHHYSTIGKTQKRGLPFPSDWNEDFYLILYPPIREAVDNGFFTSGYEHYLFHGRSEGRRRLKQQPDDWDEEGYLGLYADVSEAVHNKTMPSGWYHYELYGRGERRAPGLPVGMIESLKEMAALEPELYPSSTFLHGFPRYEAVRPSAAGEIYYDFFVATTGNSYTHVVMAPWIKTGGSDKVTLMHLKYLSNRDDVKVLLILTENTDSPWIERVPDEITIFRIDDRFSSLNKLEQKHLVFRMLATSRATTIHVINSAIGWRLLSENGVALRAQFKIFVSLFAFGYSPEGEMVGYARMVPEVWPFVDYFVTDNKYIIGQIKDIYGLPINKFYKISYPAATNARFNWSGETKKVLWASRFDREKRPDILYNIAVRLPHVEFDVFGDITIGNAANFEKLLNDFKALGNVNLKGRFNGFDSIPDADYAFFIYTSESDGLPNVLLEAHGSGLPTIAPSVGGISEIVPLESGFLIEDYRDVEKYVDTITRLLEDDLWVAAERERALNNLISERSQQSFEGAVNNLPNYA
ncbi:glycosyltransferase family 4 protein [Methylobacterium mesophilicum]